MRKWSDAYHDLTALDEWEKVQLDFIANLVGSLIERRRTLGLTQRELAEISGIKQPVIARMESGATSPRLETLIRIAYCLGMKELSIVFEELAATIAS